MLPMQRLLDRRRRRGVSTVVATSLTIALLLLAIGGVDAALRLRHQQQRADLRQRLDALAVPVAIQPTMTAPTAKSLCPPADCRGLQREYDSTLAVPATYQAFLTAFDQAGYRVDQPQSGCGGLRLASGRVVADGSLRGCRSSTSNAGNGEPLLTLVVGQSEQGATRAVVTIGAAP
jgi:hypothetical protein